MTITLNGDRFEIVRPLTVTDLLAHLDIDPRRVAVEHNLFVLKRDAFDRTVIQRGRLSGDRELRRGWVEPDGLSGDG